MGIKYPVNENFFKKWNTKMAYTLGYIYADGSLEYAPKIRGRYIRISSTDKSTIEKFKRWLNSDHKIIEISDPKNPHRKKRYLLRIGSTRLFQSLFEIGLTPNKSLTTTFPDISQEYLADFVRGYFDGDGCVHIYRKDNKDRGSIKRLSTIFTSGSFEFLKELCNILGDELSLSQRKVYSSRRSYQLRYSTSDSLKIFTFIYSNCNKESFLSRKMDIFKEYFSIRTEKIDEKIKEILIKA